MSQSLALTKSFNSLVLYSQEGFFSTQMKNIDPFIKNTSLFSYFLALELVMFYLPLGDAWLHESFHQSIMKVHGIESYNEIYEFQFFSSTISVSHVKDEELGLLKAKSNPDFVRLSAAGIEGTTLLVTEMVQQAFFRREPWFISRLSHKFINFLNSSLYIQMCTTSEAEKTTIKMNESEGDDVQSRDFTGLDFTAWVYDLFRPDIPYGARGLHPNGNIGIARYILPSQLTSEEMEYLKLQANLSFLNFIDTSYLPFDLSIQVAEGYPIRTEGNLRYYMTSFGNSIQANLYLQRQEINFLLSYHTFTNKNNFFPGLEIMLVEYPIEWLGFNLKIHSKTNGLASTKRTKLHNW